MQATFEEADGDRVAMRETMAEIRLKSDRRIEALLDTKQKEIQAAFRGRLVQEGRFRNRRVRGRSRNQ